MSAASTDRVVVLNVIEKAGGAPDKASVEQREEYAASVFSRIVPSLEENGFEVETKIAFGTDVADAIIEVAREEEATAVVFVPRGSGVLARLLSGAVSQALFGSIPEAIGERATNTVAMARGGERSPRTVREGLVDRLGE